MKLDISHLNKATQSLIHAANEVIGVLNQHGYEAYIVGGAVRNILLGQDINDIDITTNCVPDQMITFFDRTVPVGIEHGTVLVLWHDYQFEVTTFRIDGEYSDHRRPEQVQFVSDLKSDLERRDFTINALALTESLEVIDYFDGQSDLALQQIRAVGNARSRFEEDALRMMRAIRFQSVLDFDIEVQTMDAIHQFAHTIEFVSIERIITEMKKLVLGKGIHSALHIFYQSMFVHVPFFKAIKANTVQYQLHHPTDFNTYVAYIIFNEAQIGTDLLSEITHLKLSNQEKKHIKDCIEILKYFHNPKISLQRFVYSYDADLIQNVIKLIQAEELDFIGIVDYEEIMNVAQQLPIQSRDDLQINGHTLMMYLNKQPGPWLKALINTIEVEVIEGRLLNQQETILEWAKQHV
ncbi:CCA tRNA nucleotidyltransferase [Macrococcus capreoli]|uniref:CCA tRNA nucleotidyltransferase n=1 Tax=Macrococcus capreoli TaxID=2982690 RepID=UPI003EE55F2B